MVGPGAWILEGGGCVDGGIILVVRDTGGSSWPFAGEVISQYYLRGNTFFCRLTEFQIIE